MKVHNFRFSTAQVKFLQICTSIGWRSYVPWYWSVTQNLKKNQFVVSKMTTIWLILIRPLKSLRNLHFDWSLSWKVIRFDLKKYRLVIFRDSEDAGKIWRKTDFVIENDMRHLANFHQSKRKSQNWDFQWVLLSKVENVWA